jgi:glutamine cyclotransferase
MRFLFLTAAVAFCLAARADKLEVLRSIPHSGYSEGLDWHEGYLWHALEKESLKIDPKDGTVLAHYAPASEYNESLVWFKGVPYQLSYHDDGLYQGTVTGGAIAWKRVATVPEPHAWGSATDGKHVIITGNFSRKIYFLDPKTWKPVRTIETPVGDLEDLAWDGKLLWGSSFTQHPGTIFSIDPKTGAVLGYYELPAPEECPVIDGLAYDGEALWITGKHCSKVYRAAVPKARALSSKTKR